MGGAGPVDLPDLRLPLLALAAWCGALLGIWWAEPARFGVHGLWVVTALLAVIGFSGLLARAPTLMSETSETSKSGGSALRGGAVALGVAVVFVLVAAVRVFSVGASEVVLAHEAGRVAVLEGVVVSDPRALAQQFADAGGQDSAQDSAQRWQVRLKIDHLERATRDDAVTKVRQASVRGYVTLLGGDGWGEVPLGSRVRLRASPLPGEEYEHRGAPGQRAWSSAASPEVLEEPGWAWSAAAVFRAAIADSVAERNEDAAALVPSLTVGDDSRISEELADDFTTSGLTHLLAVSGTNLTLILVTVLGLGRLCGVRGRWSWLLGALCVVGFVLVARGEPSVVRAATMGCVALLALERNGTDRGLRCLAIAVLLILGWVPAMALSLGFALSALATAGILLLVPWWSARSEHWMPRWLQVALLVPLAAQVACTPVVTAIQGEVSLVAVMANVAAAPAVAPATVLGMAAGVVGSVPGVGASTLAAWVAYPAAWATTWIAWVARTTAQWPTPAVEWGSSAGALVGVTAVALGVVWVVPWLLRRAWSTVLVALVVAGAVAGCDPRALWPGVRPGASDVPEDWAVVSCDVGQGDATLLRAGEGSAVVVDTGPDPTSLRRCLDRWRVEEVPLLVLTHFHADHVGGAAALLGRMPVGEVLVSAVEEPAQSASEVTALAAEHDVPLRAAAAGEVLHVGGQSDGRGVQAAVLWPPNPRAPAFKGGDEANDNSVVLAVQVAGVSALLPGDVEPGAQRRLHHMLQSRPGGTQVDVLKVPHHGSRHQDASFIEALDAQVLLVSAGRDNTHGHPDAALVEVLEERGGWVGRTDEDGDVMVRRGDAGLETWASGSAATTQ